MAPFSLNRLGFRFLKGGTREQQRARSHSAAQPYEEVMTRHLIKTSDFETIRDGYLTSIIVKNDRLWNPGDELWFAECGSNRQLTGKVIRATVRFIQFGTPGLQAACQTMHFLPITSPPPTIRVEGITQSQAESILAESRATLHNPAKPTDPSEIEGLIMAELSEGEAELSEGEKKSLDAALSTLDDLYEATLNPDGGFRSEQMEAIAKLAEKAIDCVLRVLDPKLYDAVQRDDTVQRDDDTVWTKKLSDKWHLQGSTLIRFYEFSGSPTPNTTTSLKVVCAVYRAPAGYIMPSFDFYLRPYLYLIPDRVPFEEPGVLVTAPFLVGLMAAAPGEGTDESPLYLGGLFEVSACSIEEDPDTVNVIIDRPPDVGLCVKAFSTGSEITFSIRDDQADRPVKLRLKLQNDQDFERLYNKLLNSV